MLSTSKPDLRAHSAQTFLRKKVSWETVVGFYA